MYVYQKGAERIVEALRVTKPTVEGHDVAAVLGIIILKTFSKVNLNNCIPLWSNRATKQSDSTENFEICTEV